MTNKVLAQIKFEMGLLNQLLTAFSDPLTRAQHSAPNFIEMCALASALHSFYNGIESIFLRIAKRVDEQVPSGEEWHRELLAQMTRPTEQRNRLISDEAAVKLKDYLLFRHFYRHMYSHFLEWERMAAQVHNLPTVWMQIEKELEAFLQASESAAE